MLLLLCICLCFVLRETSCCFCQTINKLIFFEVFFNSTFRYLDDLLNIDNPYFEQMVGQVYPTELQLKKANSSDTDRSLIFGLALVHNEWIVSSKIYDKQDDFYF